MYRISLIQFNIKIQIITNIQIAVEHWSFYVVVFNKIRYIVYFIIKILYKIPVLADAEYSALDWDDRTRMIPAKRTIAAVAFMMTFLI